MNTNLQAQWQKKWREILGESTVDIPEDISCDFVLHFDIWDLESHKQNECFSLFPDGLKMLQRALTVRTIMPRNNNLDEAQLLGHLDSINRQVENVLAKSHVDGAIRWNDEKKLCESMVVYVGDNNLRRELLSSCAHPTEPLDDILPDLFELKYQEKGYPIYSFLSEPFYRIANDSVIRNSILWAALEDEYEENPYASVIELYKCRAQTGWNEAKKEMFVFVEE